MNSQIPRTALVQLLAKVSLHPNQLNCQLPALYLSPPYTTFNAAMWFSMEYLARTFGAFVNALDL